MSNSKFLVLDQVKKISVIPFVPFNFKNGMYFPIYNGSLNKLTVFKLNKKEINLEPVTLNMTVRDGRQPICQIERGQIIPFPERKMDIPKNDVLLEILKYKGINARIIEKTQRPVYNCGNFNNRKFKIATDGKKVRTVAENGQPQVNILNATFVVAYVGDKSNTYSIWMEDERGKEEVIKVLR